MPGMRFNCASQLSWAAHVAHCRQTSSAEVRTFRHSGALWTSERWYVGHKIFESQSVSSCAMV